ncbi:DNA polymerase III subunit delta [Mycoplasmopsis fermentans]|uniref:DNA polymerase III subunit delta n=1 Tax=Mycoplasmopsis fermentans TaxID=2115 RepID=UPI0001E32EB0|nr:DNA polymerase III subunit delta [Mycoplasmopsis fermentans]ADN69112.1 DNA-directed DNA polymerase [Mycoplasmopsis fermentans JER]RMX35319.1 DNA polymerase III, delta subunit [Mycoplasmopsis fermentans MF-I2]
MNFIYGSEKFFIEQEINKIVKKFPNSAITTFNIENDENVDSLIQFISSGDLFNKKRIIVINDLFYFEKKLSSNDETNVNNLIKSIDNNSSDELIFVNTNISNKEQINKNFFTNFIFNKLQQNNFIEANSIDDNQLTKKVVSLVQQKGGTIDALATSALLKKIPNDLYLINLEIDKLINQNKHITENMINVSVIDIYVEDAFGFSNSFETNDFNLIWKKYKEKLIEGVDVTVLIAQTSQLFILANQIYAYKNIGKTLENLASDFKINQYRVKKVSYLLTRLGTLKIRRMIKSLAKLDQDIKEGKTDPTIGFERFLIKFFING